jgi:hypothetical protein
MGESKVIAIRKEKTDLFLKLKHILDSPELKIEDKALADFLHPEELEAKEHIVEGLIDKEELTLFYPGCGVDIVQPLIYASKIVPSAKKLGFILADLNVSADDVISLMVQLTGNRNYRKKMIDKNTERVIFRFKDKKISFTCKTGDVLTDMPSEIVNGYDVYFERAFEICREDKPSFLKRAIHHLNQDGIIITDAGLDKGLTDNLKKLPVSSKAKALGFYKNLEMYRKTS